MMRSIYLKALILPALILILITNNQFTVSADDSPENGDISNVTCFRNIYETGDLFCGLLYELPVKNNESVLPISTPEAWCAELINTNGCTGDLIEPSEPTSLINNAAFFKIYDDTTLLGVNQIPRVGVSVGSVYLTNGHGVTWADANINVCLENNPNIYDNTLDECINVIWNGVADTQAANREALGNWLISAITAIGINESRSFNYYITNGKINTNGLTRALEAVPNATKILGDIFTTSNTVISIPTVITGTPGVNSGISAANPNVASASDDLSGTLITTNSADIFRVIMGILLCLAAFLFIFYFTKPDYIWPGFALMSMAWTVSLFDLFPVEIPAVITGIMAIIATPKIVKMVVAR